MTTAYLDNLALTDEERARIQDLGDALQITLVESITYTHNKFDGERTITDLRLPKKIKGKHMKAMDKASGEISQALALVAALAGVPAHAMDELDSRDLDLVQVLIGPFLPKSRATGTS